MDDKVLQCIVALLCIFIPPIIVLIIAIINENKPKFEEVEEDAETQYKIGYKHYQDALEYFKKSARRGNEKAQQKLKQIGEEW